MPHPHSDALRSMADWAAWGHMDKRVSLKGNLSRFLAPILNKAPMLAKAPDIMQIPKPAQSSTTRQSLIARQSSITRQSHYLAEPIY